MSSIAQVDSTDTDHPGYCADTWTGPVFVVGMWRSGTSLLYSLLNQHSEVALMYEGDLAVLEPYFWIRRKKKDWLAKWELWNKALSRHRIESQCIPGGKYDLRSAIETAYIEYARQKKGAITWGCKSPNYCNLLSRLARLFPHSRFIIIWRDLRGICRSVDQAAKTSSFFQRRGMMLRTILGYRRLKAECDRLIAHGANVHQLYFEDLVQSPDQTMMRICAFLRIPFEPRMTSLEEADRSAIEDFRHHALVKGRQIRTPSHNPDSLSVRLRARIEGYIALWREQSNNQWPRFPKTLNAMPKLPAWERILDRLLFLFLRAWDLAVLVSYSYAPLWIWSGYRRRKYKRRRALQQRVEQTEAGT